MRRYISLGFICLIYFLAALPVDAEYVLPYPSYMPGNKLFKVSRIVDSIKSWWYWGSLSQVKYHMELSDKYLVEAKTLFEYKQYLLALDALRLSDWHIAKIPGYFDNAKKEGKQVDQFSSLFLSEREVHTKVLLQLQQTLPATFVWTPEKQSPVTLNLFDDLEKAMKLRSSLR